MISIREQLSFFSGELIDELEMHGTYVDLHEGTEVLREGQYIKMIPIVLSGAIKVFTRSEEKELLLYNIEPGESCVMSFMAGLRNTASRVFAVAEENSTVLLLPASKLQQWVKQYPCFNQLFFHLYDQRYSSLLDTVNHLLYNKLDTRIYAYLLEKSRQKQTRFVEIRHRQIASELGTVREVVSRLLKKLEQEGKIKQLAHGIEILKEVTKVTKIR